MRKVLATAFAGTLLLASMTVSAQAATPKAGAACAKAGITQVVKAGTKTTKFTCVKWQEDCLEQGCCDHRQTGANTDSYSNARTKSHTYAKRDTNANSYRNRTREAYFARQP